MSYIPGRKDGPAPYSEPEQAAVRRPPLVSPIAMFFVLMVAVWVVAIIVTG